MASKAIKNQLEAFVEPIEVTPFQQLVLAIPESFDLALLGGRGGGKSYGIAHLFLRNAEAYGPKFRALYVRKTYKGIADFEDVLRQTFFAAYGAEAVYSMADHVWRLPTGAYIELGQIESPADYQKFQGRSFTLIVVDEATQYAEPTLIDKLRSNLRGPKEVPLRFILSANPGDVGHAWVMERYVTPSDPWVPFYEKFSKRQFVRCQSSFRDNPKIDREQYLQSIEAACAGDLDLLRAWRDGAWDALQAGAYFSHVLSWDKNAIRPWPDPDQWWDWRPDGWKFYLAHDLGWSSPSVTYVCVRSPGGFGPDNRYYPHGSIILLDELATYVPGFLDRGQDLTTSELCELIKDMCASWKIRPRGIADDQILAVRGGEGSENTYQTEYERFGVYLQPARKGDRVSGWVRMKTLMKGAHTESEPGLFISKRCKYFWQTVPNLQRAERNPEDVEKCSTDHGADAARYACLEPRATGTFGVSELRL